MTEIKKINYQKILENTLKEITGKKPSLLLHACCAPCSSYVIEYLSTYFDMTIYYYNPNIHPENEYERRLQELKTFLQIFPLAKKNNVSLIVDKYDPQEYFSNTNVLEDPSLQTEPEKGERCRRCYEFRMKKAYSYACKNHFDWFTTTLSISPHKDSEKINIIGKNLEENCPDTVNHKTRFLYSDFKKKGGFLRSTQLSSEYKLWRQDYCGCIYSKQNIKHQ